MVAHRVVVRAVGCRLEGARGDEQRHLREALRGDEPRQAPGVGPLGLLLAQARTAPSLRVFLDEQRGVAYVAAEQGEAADLRGPVEFRSAQRAQARFHPGDLMRSRGRPGDGEAREPGVVVVDQALGDGPLPQSRTPLFRGGPGGGPGGGRGAGRGAERQVPHQDEELVLGPDMAVEGHRRDAQLLRDPGQRGTRQPVAVGQFHPGTHHALGVERGGPAEARGRGREPPQPDQLGGHLVPVGRHRASPSRTSVSHQVHHGARALSFPHIDYVLY